MAVEALPQLEPAQFGEARGADWPDLSDVLLAGERVLLLTRGRVRTGRIPQPQRWFVIVTDRRLICLQDSRRSARRQLHVALNRIEHAYQRGVLGGKVVVVTRRGKIRIAGLGRYAGGQLVARLLYGERAGEVVLTAGAPATLPLPALPLAAAIPQEAVLSRVEELEAVVDRMTQQLRFLEELLRSRQGPTG
jgi:hypothetical protein